MSRLAAARGWVEVVGGVGGLVRFCCTYVWVGGNNGGMGGEWVWLRWVAHPRCCGNESVGCLFIYFDWRGRVPFFFFTYLSIDWKGRTPFYLSIDWRGRMHGRTHTEGVGTAPIRTLLLLWGNYCSFGEPFGKKLRSPLSGSALWLVPSFQPAPYRSRRRRRRTRSVQVSVIVCVVVGVVAADGVDLWLSRSRARASRPEGRFRSRWRLPGGGLSFCLVKSFPLLPRLDDGHGSICDREEDEGAGDRGRGCLQITCIYSCVQSLLLLCYLYPPGRRGAADGGSLFPPYIVVVVVDVTIAIAAAPGGSHHTDQVPP